MWDGRWARQTAMTRHVLLGNSGSGKSTLAARLARASALPHLDLDTLAWLPTQPPQRRPLAESARAIAAFVAANEHWGHRRLLCGPARARGAALPAARVPE